MITKVTIFGGAGFVGANLAKHLSSIGYKVTVADNLVRRGSERSLPLLKEKGITFIHCDIRNKEDFINLPKTDIILNCAAQPSAINYSNPEFDYTNNTHGVVNILEYSRKNKTPIIFWSTNKCYSGDLVNSVPSDVKDTRLVWSNPAYKLDGWSNCGFNERLAVDGKDHSIYGASKIASDLLLQEWADAFDIPAICNRFSCLAGPNQWGKAEQGWVTWFAIANELELPVSFIGYNGFQVRDCLFTDDINSLITEQIYNINKYRGEVFNVGGGINNTLSVVEATQILASKNKDWKPFIYEEKRRADQKIYISDITKVSKEFNWTPKVTIDQGYDQILDWVKTNKNILKELYV